MFIKKNRSNMKKYNLKEIMAVMSFGVGSLIAMVCLFIIEPLGEIASTAISIVSEFLVLTGALLGVDAHFDHKMKTFETKIRKSIEKENETHK